MKAIVFDGPGEPDVLTLADVPAPALGAAELRIGVRATAVNRADLMQRRGSYPPPQGASSILGLEAAGTVLEIGPAAAGAGFHVGQRVMALLAGGGYAEEVVVPVGQVLPTPDALSDEQAAAVPETFLTAYLNLFLLGGLAAIAPPAGPDGPPQVLIHGGASGVGTAAIQLCRQIGARVLCTVGSAERAARCQQLGADFTWNYLEGDFTEPVLQATDQRGVDLVLDCIGGKYLDGNVRVLAVEGKLLCIGLMGGVRAPLDLARLLAHRLQIIGSTLRGLPLARKAWIVQRFSQEILPWLASGKIGPIIDQIFPLSQAAAAHRAMDAHHVGKIVLQIAP